MHTQSAVSHTHHILRSKMSFSRLAVTGPTLVAEKVAGNKLPKLVRKFRHLLTVCLAKARNDVLKDSVQMHTQSAVSHTHHILRPKMSFSRLAVTGHTLQGYITPSACQDVIVWAWSRSVKKHWFWLFLADIEIGCRYCIIINIGKQIAYCE